MQLKDGSPLLYYIYLEINSSQITFHGINWVKYSSVVFDHICLLDFVCANDLLLECYNLTCPLLWHSYVPLKASISKLQFSLIFNIYQTRY